MVLAYEIMVPALMFLGALIAWASYENHRMKLLAIAVAAPALITTWAGGATAATKFAFGIVDTAVAGDETGTATDNQVSVGNALKLFFGIGKDEERYRVVVGSFKDKSDAAIFADKIRKTNPGVEVYVSERRGENEFFPVIVGGYASYPEASNLRSKIRDATGIRDVFLSPKP